MSEMPQKETESRTASFTYHTAYSNLIHMYFENFAVFFKKLQELETRSFKSSHGRKPEHVSICKREDPNCFLKFSKTKASEEEPQTQAIQVSAQQSANPGSTRLSRLSGLSLTRSQSGRSNKLHDPPRPPSPMFSAGPNQDAVPPAKGSSRRRKPSRGCRGYCLSRRSKAPVPASAAACTPRARDPGCRGWGARARLSSSSA